MRGTSRLWFTVAQGIVTGAYYPRPDIPQLKDMGFIVADGVGFWIEVRWLGDYVVAWQDEAIPAITVTHRHARFTPTLKVCVDPERDTRLLAGRAVSQAQTDSDHDKLREAQFIQAPGTAG